MSEYLKRSKLVFYYHKILICLGFFIGSGALPGKMIELGLMKISLRNVFFLFLAPADSSNPVGPNPNHFPNPAGQS